MSETFEPSRVAAIVVGIEQYGFRRPVLNLRAPGSHAVEFVELLKKAGVGLDQVHLFLSLREPQSQDQRLAGLDYPNKVRDAGKDLESFFTNDLSTIQSDLLYIYWCGHGAQVGAERRLLYGDANDTLLHNLSVPELLQYLHSDNCSQKMQIVFLDACAERSDLEAQRLQAKTVLWGPNDPIARVKRSLFCYYACAPWQTAQSKDGVSYFSRAVLDILSKAPAHLLAPDPKDWNSSIKSRFKSLWPQEASRFGPVSYFDSEDDDERSGVLVAGTKSKDGKTVRERLLDEVQEERIDPYLHQGLRQAIQLDLQLTELPGAVNARLREYARLESGEVPDKPINESARQVFEKARGQLLILGNPGVGKTSLLLEIAQSLVEQARFDLRMPVPIVLSLPRWAQPKTTERRDRTLAEWIQDDLVAEYKISEKAAAELVKQDSLIPLLDGLDEVAEDRRATCVEKIHEYQRGRTFGHLAVCCRVEDYARLPRLALSRAIRIETLTTEDIERELNRPGLESARLLVKTDPTLLDILNTPLWLNVLYGAAQVEAGDQIPDPDPQKRLYGRYVEYALGRKPTVDGESQTSRALLLRRLGWLAREMQRADQSDFTPGDFDSYWLDLRLHPLVVPIKAFVMSGLVGGILGGLRFGAALGAASAFDYLIWPILVRWLAFSRYGKLIGTKTGNLLMSALAALQGIFTLSLAGVVFLRESSEGPVGLRLGEAAVMFSVGSSIAYHVLSATFLTERSGLRTVRSTPHFLILTISSILGLLLQIGLTSQSSSPALRQFAIPYGVSRVILNIAEAKLMPIAIHFVLWLRGVAPFRYPELLNEAARRLFLVRSGGTYAFFHITFRDYMASSYGVGEGVESR